VQRGRDEVKVMVRYPKAARRELDTLRTMRVRSSDGTAVPFSIVAETSFSESLASIERADFKRVVAVTAEIDKSKTSEEEILADLQANYYSEFFARHPQVQIALRGEAEQREKSMKSLKVGFVTSIILIYVLLAVPLKSYVRPLFIMSVIPFGIGGAILGHYVYGLPLSILSMFGTLALSGVVVNDSLVFVHRIHDVQSAHPDLSLAEAIHRTAQERFRPILLTSLTTFVGLIPLLAETAVQAQFLKPMAVSLGFGVLFSTGVTLLLLPMILLIAQDVSTSFRWWFRLCARSNPSPQ
jgi:multidrug efflux pump subunit AcrB